MKSTNVILVLISVALLFLVACQTQETVQQVEQREQPSTPPMPPGADIPQPPAENVAEEAAAIPEVEDEVLVAAESEPEPAPVPIPEPAQEPTAVQLGTNYYEYNKAHYEYARAQGKVIFLDFHADWCPICKREHPNILAAFAELNNPDVVGYQVHYRDSFTDKDEEAIAKELGIALQHTKVILDREGNVQVKSLEEFSKQKTLDSINQVI